MSNKFNGWSTFQGAGGERVITTLPTHSKIQRVERKIASIEMD